MLHKLNKLIRDVLFGTSHICCLLLCLKAPLTEGPFRPAAIILFRQLRDCIAKKKNWKNCIMLHAFSVMIFILWWWDWCQEFRVDFVYLAVYVSSKADFSSIYLSYFCNSHVPSWAHLYSIKHIFIVYDYKLRIVLKRIS